MGETQKKEKKKIGLTTKIFIALLTGAVFGIILCYAVPSGHIKDDIIVEGVLYVVGQGFIKLMKMLVVPLVFCSLVCGSMSIGDTKKLGTVGARTLIFYLATTALAVTVALSVGNLINPGVGLDMSTIKTNAACKRRDVADHRICIDHRCDPCKIRRTRRDSCELLQPV